LLNTDDVQTRKIIAKQQITLTAQM
jgi:hypothetical protein